MPRKVSLLSTGCKPTEAASAGTSTFHLHPCAFGVTMGSKISWIIPMGATVLLLFSRRIILIFCK